MKTGLFETIDKDLFHSLNALPGLAAEDDRNICFIGAAGVAHENLLISNVLIL